MSDFNKACDELIVAIGDDYKRWRLRGDYYSDESIAKFREELTLNPGRKYMKITNEDDEELEDMVVNNESPNTYTAAVVTISKETQFSTN